MEGIATEISQPLMAYNGDYIQHVGSNPSGQNLTVYINSIVNSLLFRCAFFHICKDREITCFRDVCSLITYGDDAKSSVKKGWEEFNHIAVANFLADRDMKFTMPDKTSTPTKFMTDDDADLLKRANVLNPDTGLVFGALDNDSIFKSLHSVVRSKAVSNEEQCVSNIDGALREWFAHGREVYEMRRAQMKEIAEKADLTYGCRELDNDYDYCLARFCEKYEVELLDNQCGGEYSVETVPFYDHCIGTYMNIYFWWEWPLIWFSEYFWFVIWGLAILGKLDTDFSRVKINWMNVKSLYFILIFYENKYIFLFTCIKFLLAILYMKFLKCCTAPLRKSIQEFGLW